jgi:hypothetical protein
MEHNFAVLALKKAVFARWLPAAGGQRKGRICGVSQTSGALATYPSAKNSQASKQRKGSWMLIGAHIVIYSTNPDADRDFLRDFLKLPNVEAGDGYLIFGLPSAEVAVHPSNKNDVHELYLMCEDIEEFIAEMKKQSIGCTPIQDQGWGLLTRATLPGGGTLGIYQPRHARPASIASSKKGVN